VRSNYIENHTWSDRITFTAS